MYHLYADDTIIYCSASSVKSAFAQLQSAFNIVQSRLEKLKLVLNAEKSKVMLFSNAKSPATPPELVTSQGGVIELVQTYKYLGFILDSQLSFKAHIASMVSKLRIKLGFYYRNKSCFSSAARRYLVSATFLPLLDYGDCLYMNASVQCLRSLDTVYHGALRFMTGCERLTHHCDLYERSDWPSLTVRRGTHWLTFIYKSLLGLVPCYLSSLLQRSYSHYNLRSHDVLKLSVPKMRTVWAEKAFKHAAPSDWNKLQEEIKLPDMISMNAFQIILKNQEVLSGRKERELCAKCACP